MLKERKMEKKDPSTRKIASVPPFLKKEKENTIICFIIFQGNLIYQQNWDIMTVNVSIYGVSTYRNKHVAKCNCLLWLNLSISHKSWHIHNE